MIEAREVTVRFGGITALDAVDLEVGTGQIVGLVGPNGAGKTTLFDVISGLRRPDHGRVLIHGSDVTSLGPATRARRGMARTFQRSELFAELTVREHLQLAHRARHRPGHLVLDLLGLGRRTDPDERTMVDALLDTIGLGPVAHRLPVSLPLGTGRLVEVARALASSPDIVLLDEPSAGLDEHETDQLAEALRRSSTESGAAMLLVEHDVDLVLGLSELVYVLDFGRVIAHGTPGAIRADPAVRLAYLGADT